MANEEHLKILERGVSAWNDWRIKHPRIVVDLEDASLREAKLSGIDLKSTNLIAANLFGTQLVGADLSGALLMRAKLIATNLSGANLSGAYLTDANCDGANFSGADLSGADLRDTNLLGVHLQDANLSGANLFNANLRYTSLKGANFDVADISHAVISGVDLSEAIGLEAVNHGGPSDISISTIYDSEGKIPEIFLRGCGVPDEFITQIPALVAAMQPIQFHSCFISYSNKDEEFARRLHERMRAAGLRVWYAPEEIKGGEKLYEQIDRAIQVHDRLLLVLSESSLQSEWVMTEIRRARKAEIKEGRRKLFPIRLTGYDTLKEWECFDADQGKDLAVEVREYFIPDFSNWKSHDDFEKAFARLLSDLKASTR
ncbi:MAG TPA: toll/interleukin-1 receptor domain-containing protein [Pyrinomonadaceae bacterium]|nr:toll/interleukin-1 receptor domain-containing protein [Pyrinomonadaceae bacterium]